MGIWNYLFMSWIASDRDFRMIEQIIRPKAKDLGDGFMVRRSLPDVKKRHVGPFIFWDHMGPVQFQAGQDLKVRAHPHIGLATITYLFSGEIFHRDSLGFEQPIRPGEVNWMTAGKGIVHSERTHSGDRVMSLEGIQVWIALPKEFEDVDPSFVHIESASVPKINAPGIQMELIAGEILQHKSPAPVHSPLFYLSCRAEALSEVNIPIPAIQESAVYVVEGEIEVGGETYRRFDLIVFRAGQSVQFKNLTATKTMIFGGQPFPEKRHMWWNLVSSDPEKIERAKQDWKARRFAQVINETEWIPLPEDV